MTRAATARPRQTDVPSLAAMPPGDGYLEATPHVLVNDERCAGCQECVIRCPAGALDLDPVAWKVVGSDPLCVGCRQCERTCPFGAIAVTGPLLVAPRVTVEQPVPSDIRGDITPTRPAFGYADAMREAERCLQCPDPTCVLGCPADNDIPAFIAAIRDEDWDEAHAVLRRTSMMPDVCSRVCDQSLQCEGACSWKLAGGDPVAIGQLERFVTEQRPVPELRRRAPGPSAKRVAVIGSGPAGMAAAWELLEKGARVTMFERENVTGGVLAWGIPGFTLPEAVARRPMAALRRAGLELRTRVEVDEDALAKLRREYDAVVLAQGASEPARLPVPGADAEGVEDATSFLRRAKLALLSESRDDRHLPDLPEGAHLLVVGAGNTAMDVARSARRLGCEVTAIDWFDRRFAAVREDELLEAEREGVRIAFNRMVERFEDDDGGNVVAAVLLHTRQRRADRLPQRVAGAPERLAVTHVVLATGYRVGGPFPEQTDARLPVRPPRPGRAVPPRSLTASGLPAGSRRLGELVRGRAYLRARAAEPLAASLWAAGDSLSGPSTVVGAMAQGMAVAREIVHDAATDGAGAGAIAAPERGDGAPMARAAVTRFGGASASSRRLPGLGLAAGLLLEATGVLLLAVTGRWLPAILFFVPGAVAGLAGLNGWVGGWVRAQER